jgi:hypothetical protein
MMTCPPEIAAVLLDILGDGLLTCRAAGWAGRPERCAVEADHLHNLPALLADYSPDRLRYYWDVERPTFAERCPPESLPRWETHWERLRPLVEEATVFTGFQ